MRLVQYCFILFLAIPFSSCERDRVWVEHELDCCPPWGVDINTPAEELAESFFEQNDIPVFETRIRDNGQRARCTFCCNCPSGEFVGLLINRDHLGAAANLEFREQ